LPNAGAAGEGGVDSRRAGLAVDIVRGGALALSTGVGAIGGLIPGAAVPDLTAVRNSANVIFNRIVTKAEKGTIDFMSGTTAANMDPRRFVFAAKVERAEAFGVATGVLGTTKAS
jgi:hypothetical protein